MALKIQDLIDIEQFQQLQDRLNEIYSFPSAIIDNDGNVLTATAWQDICTKFHRQNSDCLKECIKSDQYILSHLHEANPAVSYRCPHGLVDNATPIIIDGVHYGNYFTGQFFLETPDLDFFLAQAKRYGFDEEAYIEAVKKVPIWTQEQLNSYLCFIKGLIEVIASTGLKNLKDIEAGNKIKASEERHRTILKTAMDGIWLVDMQGRLLEVNETYCRMSGYSEQELLVMRIPDLEIVEKANDTDAHIQKIIAQGEDRFESRHRRKDGSVYDVEVSVQYRSTGDGQMIAFLRDISEHKLAEEKLVTGHKLLSNLANLVPGVIYQYRLYPDGRSAFPYASQAMNDIYEVTPEEVREDATPVFGRLHPDDLDRVAADIFESARTLETFYCTFRVILPRQGLRWRWSQAQPQRLDDGSTLWHGIISDITERKQAEEKLAQERERLSAIIRGTNVGTWEWNVQSGETVFNDRWTEIIGYTLDELSPVSIETWMKFAHPDDLHKSGALLEQHFAGILDYYEYESRMKHKNGDWIWVLDRGKVASWTADGKPLMMFGTHHDITERKRSEEDLKKNQQLLAISQRLAHMGSWETELSTGKLSWSDEMYHVMGFPDASPVYLDMALSVFPPDELIHFREAISSAIRGDAPYNIDYTIKRHDGQVRTIHDEGEVVFDEHGTAVRMFGITQDITEHKRAEEEKVKLEAQLQQSQKMESVGRLAGGVAHDFNNMLGVVLGHTEIAIERLGPDHPLLANLEEIRNAANRSADLTRQLLAFARRQVVAPKVLDPNETVEGMLKMLLRLLGEDIHLAWLPGANLWPVKVDPSQIDQILVNLCINARDAIAGVGRITIETVNVSFDKTHCDDHPGFVAGEYVLFSVSDDGSGMDKETIDKIFEPFFTTKGIGKGTGLGLATVYGIVKQNNGFIDVYSEPDEGTTFRIYLPRHIGQAEQIQQEAISKPIPRGQETILVVEDEPSLLDLSKIMLESQGYLVLAAGSPSEAVHLAKEHTGEIHLLMTDVVMPEMNGQDLAKKMLPLYRNMKCLFTSGYTADVIAHHGVLDAGVYFIQKPFSRRDLAARVREVLDQK